MAIGLVGIEDAQQQRDSQHEDEEKTVFTREEGHRTLANVACNLFHAVGTDCLCRYPVRGIPGIRKREHAKRGDKPE